MATEQLTWRGMESEQTDAALIERSLRAPEVFAAIFDRHADRVYRYLARRAGPTVADDLVSDTFLAAFERRERYDADQSPTGALPWLLGIATRLLSNHRRSEARRWKALTLSDPEGSEPSPAERVAAKVDADAVARSLVGALAGLGAGERDALLLLAWGDLTYREIAAALGVPVGTVRSRIHRARSQLRTSLEPFDIDDWSDRHG